MHQWICYFDCPRTPTKWYQRTPNCVCMGAICVCSYPLGKGADKIYSWPNFHTFGQMGDRTFQKSDSSVTTKVRCLDYTENKKGYGLGPLAEVLESKADV